MLGVKGTRVKESRVHNLGVLATAATDYDDVAAKALFADSCDAPWPCKGGSDGCAAGHDFGGCPKGWSQGRFAFCEAAGKGPCDLRRVCLRVGRVS